MVVPCFIKTLGVLLLAFYVVNARNIDIAKTVEESDVRPIEENVLELLKQQQTGQVKEEIKFISAENNDKKKETPSSDKKDEEVYLSLEEPIQDSDEKYISVEKRQSPDRLARGRVRSSRNRMRARGRSRDVTRSRLNQASLALLLDDSLGFDIGGTASRGYDGSSSSALFGQSGGYGGRSGFGSRLGKRDVNDDDDAVDAAEESSRKKRDASEKATPLSFYQPAAPVYQQPASNFYAPLPQQMGGFYQQPQPYTYAAPMSYDNVYAQPQQADFYQQQQQQITDTRYQDSVYGVPPSYATQSVYENNYAIVRPDYQPPQPSYDQQQVPQAGYDMQYGQQQPGPYDMQYGQQQQQPGPYDMQQPQPSYDQYAAQPGPYDMPYQPQPQPSYDQGYGMQYPQPQQPVYDQQPSYDQGYGMQYPQPQPSYDQGYGVQYPQQPVYDQQPSFDTGYMQQNFYVPQQGYSDNAYQPQNDYAPAPAPVYQDNSYAQLPTSKPNFSNNPYGISFDSNDDDDDVEFEEDDQGYGSNDDDDDDDDASNDQPQPAYNYAAATSQDQSRAQQVDISALTFNYGQQPQPVPSVRIESLQPQVVDIQPSQPVVVQQVQPAQTVVPVVQVQPVQPMQQVLIPVQKLQPVQPVVIVREQSFSTGYGQPQPAPQRDSQVVGYGQAAQQPAPQRDTQVVGYGQVAQQPAPQRDTQVVGYGQAAQQPAPQRDTQSFGQQAPQSQPAVDDSQTDDHVIDDTSSFSHQDQQLQREDQLVLDTVATSSYDQAPVAQAQRSQQASSYGQTQTSQKTDEVVSAQDGGAAYEQQQQPQQRQRQRTHQKTFPAPSRKFKKAKKTQQQQQYTDITYGSEQQEQQSSQRAVQIPNANCPTGIGEPIYEGDQIAETYCRCGDSYGINCREGFVNPCKSGVQFSPADASLPPKYFIHCSWNIPYLKKCSASLIWSQSLETCIWPNLPLPQQQSSQQQDIAGSSTYSSSSPY